MTHTHLLSGPERGHAVGIVAPFDLELDRELWRWAPSDVDILITRTPFINDGVTVEFAKEVADTGAISRGTKDVTSGRARTVAYACTSGSFVSGRLGEKAITEAMLASGAEQALTTSGSLVEALQSLGAKQVVVATPYLAELSIKLSEFLEEFGITALENVSLGLCEEIWSVSYEDTANMIRSADRPDADAIVISCTNLPTYGLIAPLEAELGKPIVSANQATMWALLRRIGKEAVGADQLLIARSRLHD